MPSRKSKADKETTGSTSEVELLRKQNDALSKQLESMTDLIRELKSEIASLREIKRKDLAETQRSVPDPAPPLQAEWVDVKTKKNSGLQQTGQGNQKKVEGEDKAGIQKPALSLRAEDWPVPILKSEDLKDGAQGIILLSQTEGEKFYNDLATASGRIGLITPKPIMGAGDKCRAVEVKIVTAAGRLTVAARHLTSIGEGNPIKAKYEKQTEMKSASVEIEDKSLKVVVKVADVVCHESLYDKAVRNPQPVISEWLATHLGRENVLHMTRPMVKKVNTAGWVESILTIRKSALEKFHKASGRNGVFTKVYRTGNATDDALRIVRFDPGAAVDDALTRARLHGDAAHGLEWGPWGLGVRVPKDGFADKVKRMFGKEKAKAEVERIGGSIYEISKLPPWVEYEDVQAQLLAKWNWATTLIRVARGWNTKRFLVRSSTPPNRDAFVIGDHWCPVQQAPDRNKPNVLTLRLREGNGQGRNVPVVRPPTRSMVSVPAPSTLPSTATTPGFETAQKLEALLDGLWKKVEARFAEMEDRINEFTWDRMEDDNADLDKEDGTMEAEGASAVRVKRPSSVGSAGRGKKGKPCAAS